jgi:hypothetical protein
LQQYYYYYHYNNFALDVYHIEQVGVVVVLALAEVVRNIALGGVIVIAASQQGKCITLEGGGKEIDGNEKIRSPPVRRSSLISYLCIYIYRNALFGGGFFVVVGCLFSVKSSVRL